MNDMEENILKVIERNKDIISLIPYDPKVNLPDTITPNTVLKFFENEECIQWDSYNKHLLNAGLYYDHNDPPIKELIESFLNEVKSREYELFKAKPLPHIPSSFIFYRPVKIFYNGYTFPARLISSWSHSHQAFYITLDTVIPIKTWREEKSML